jgi:hypothetical protein
MLVLSCRHVGVLCVSTQAALRHGRPVTADVSNTLADGLAVPMVRRSGEAQLPAE